jgi:hypothetical protein
MKSTFISHRKNEALTVDKGRPRLAAGLTIIYVLTFAVLVLLLVRGFSYYLTPYYERPHHPEYSLLRPAGSWGLGFGVVGAFMMILMLTYSLRKRIKSFTHMGSLAGWLRLHIYLGIVGPVLIVLHTSFKVQGLVAVSFWSMVVVALSGYFGRYLYLQIPRNIQGHELGLHEIEESNRALSAMLSEEYKVGEDQLVRLDALVDVRLPQRAGLWRSLLVSFISDIGWIFKRRRVQKEYGEILSLPRTHLRQLMRLMRERAQLRRRILLLSRIQQLFHYWHVVHKPFAIVMYIVMTVHISIAFWTGYTWIF